LNKGYGEGVSLLLEGKKSLSRMAFFRESSHHDSGAWVCIASSQLFLGRGKKDLLKSFIPSKEEERRGVLRQRKKKEG